MITKYNKLQYNHLILAILISIVIVLPIAIFSVDSIESLKQNTNDSTILLLSYFVYTFTITFVFMRVSHLNNKNRHLKMSKFKILQFDFLQKQLDSHFTFNVLNSVSASILADKKQDAYHLLTVFSKVLRYTYDNKSRLFHQLDNEMELVENYLKLEKYRFKDKFDYYIQVKGNVDMMTHIPKQSIQIHVDNAVKHGLMPLTTGGVLNITIEEEKDMLHITVEDNGIGRSKSNSFNMGIRKDNSIHTMVRMIDYFNDLFPEKKINIKVFDLFKNGKPSGTRVVSNIPNGLQISQ